MEIIKFEQIPEAVCRIFEKLDTIELILKNRVDTPNPSTDEILTIKETAEFLNLKVPTVYGLTQKAKIPYFKQGNRLYFSKPELIKWIKSGRKKTLVEITNVASNYLLT